MAGKTKDKGLNDQQKRFADYYLLTLKIQESAIKAGYSPKGAHVTGSRLLRNVKVQEYMKSQRENTEELLGISKIKVLKGLSTVLDRCLETSVVLDAFGNPVIKKIKVPVDENDPLGEKNEIEAMAVIVRSDPKGVIAAADQLAKYQGWHAPAKVQDVTESPLSSLGKRLFGSE